MAMFELYQQARNLESIGSKEIDDFEAVANDVDEDTDEKKEAVKPFARHYEARKFYEQVLLELEANAKTETVDENATGLRDVLRQSCKAAIFLRLASNYVETEEKVAGRQQYERCIEILRDLQVQSETVYLKIVAENCLGWIALDHEEFDLADALLNEAVVTYETFKGTKDNMLPLSLDAVVELASGSPMKIENIPGVESAKLFADFEKLHTLTLSYLAQFYRAKNESRKSAEYCEMALIRQLGLCEGEYDPLEWALNSATLSQYYMNQETASDFWHARHCLASAELVLKQYNPNDAAGKRRKAEFEAQLQRSWANYCISILEISKRKLLEPEDAENTRGLEESVQPISKFPLPDLTATENQITSNIVRTFSEAREVFLKGQYALNEAKKFYALNDYCSDFIDITRDISRLFKLVAFFESDIDRICKMHKRRIDLLSGILKKLNQDIYLMYCRQLLFEIAETFNEMMDLKTEKLEDSGTDVPNLHQTTKINFLIRNSIENFRKFLETFRDKDAKFPQKFDTDFVRSVLVAHFYIGRLYGKFLTADPKKKLENLTKSLDEYRFVVIYCENFDPESMNAVKSEYEVSKDMVHLLPVKMDRLKEFIV